VKIVENNGGFTAEERQAVMEFLCLKGNSAKKYDNDNRLG
jgi:hypothetical protein